MFEKTLSNSIHKNKKWKSTFNKNNWRTSEMNWTATIPSTENAGIFSLIDE